MREIIARDMAKVLAKLSVPADQLHLEHPENPNFGDYSTNIALRYKNPAFGSVIDWANEIVNTWRLQGLPEYLAKIEVVQPGFINLWLTKESLVSSLEHVLKQKEKYGQLQVGQGKTAVIDYSAPNIAKAFGIGHLRSTDIGQALYNLYRFAGWKTVGDNHLGDWGTQFGKLIYQIEFKIKSAKLKVNDLTIEKLEELYVEFHQQAIEHPEMEDEARAWFKKLEDHDPEAVRIWKKCVEISLKEYTRIYKLLDVEIDYAYGESFYEKLMQEVIADARQRKLTEESQGALVISLPGLKVPLILLKSDGATTYETRELATIKFRLEKWRPDLIIWEVGADQKFHFQKVFAAAKLLNYGKQTSFVHVPHGLIRWESGKFSTREGKTVHLEEILEEAINRAKKIIRDSATGRGLNATEKEKVAQAVGIGAVKYSDLKQNPQTDIVFDWERMFNLEGDSGPYLQYTYARCFSVLSKAKSSKQLAGYSLQLLKKLNTENWSLEAEELALLRSFYRFPEVIEEAAENFAPNLLCGFLFALAQKYNLLYNKLPILKSSDEIRPFRLALTQATAQVLKNGLTLLGIKVLERM